MIAENVERYITIEGLHKVIDYYSSVKIGENLAETKDSVKFLWYFEYSLINCLNFAT